MSIKRLFLLSVCLFMLTSVMVNAQDDTTKPLFHLSSPDPIILHGKHSAWDGTYTDPGAVVYHDGLFHMFRNGFKGWPASVEIGYLTSPDGITWMEASTDPVIRSADVPLTKLAALASSVLVEDDGTWVLYFYTWNTRNSLDGEGQIGRATAPAPTGPWTIDATPALTGGEKGAWDEAQVDSPSVVKTDDGYFMYYTGRSKSGVFQIGLATSDDGITWAKHGEPVLTGDQPWENGMVHQPRVVSTPDGFVMVYRIPGRHSDMRLAVATSKDGISWTKRDAPILKPQDISIVGQSQMWFTALAYHDDEYDLFVEANHLGGTSIYGLSSDVDLFKP